MNVFRSAPETEVDSNCYEDNRESRIFKRNRLVQRSKMTVDVCIRFCSSSGASYAGLENSVECYCSNDSPDASLKRPQQECDQRCSGDQSQYCGGPARLSVYQSGEIQCASSILSQQLMRLQ